jgi:hypothetical protein
MKLSELTVCDGCGGPLFTPPGRWFQLVRTSGALITPDAVEVIRAAARQGIPLQRVETDRTSPDIHVLGDANRSHLDELQLCVPCYHTRPIAPIVRRRRERIEILVAQGRVS